MNDSIKPPIAKKELKITKIHGLELHDDYYWLRNKENQAVINYLTEENEFTKAKTKHLDTFVEDLFQEMKNRIKEDDESVPYKLKDYYYYNRNEKDKEYKIYCRKHLNLENEEEILLDLNKMAEGLEYYKIQTMKISPNQKLLAFSEDKTGYEKFAIFVKNLETGEISSTGIENIGWNFEWSDDNTIYYNLRDEAQRPYALKKHVLGTSVKDDVVIFEENDTKRRIYVWKSNDKKYIFMNSESSLSSEIRFLDLEKPHDDFTIFLPREEKHEYSIAHKEGYFYITTNTDDSTNFKVMRTPTDKLSKESWEEIIPHDEDVRILGIGCFKDFQVIVKRTKGLKKIEIFYNKNDERNHDIQLPEPVYGVWNGANAEYSTDFFRIIYTSLITPMSTFDYHLKEKKLELKKEEEVKKYNKEEFTTERQFVEARDGSKIPISIVQKKGIKKPAPTMIYGYGSYGSSEDPYFSPTRLSLVERGMIFVIAHIRGGGELGRQWYEDGKFLKKKNTFNDFIDCSKYLIDNRYTTSEQLIAMGASAGGLLMGAIMNMNPELYNLIIARVPFVDVINTMLDESIPLTSEEWEEWGDPRDKEYFDYMLSYSPYDNVEAKDYPTTLVTSGLNDPRVAFWEPAKFVAKLRVLKTDSNELLLKTNMGAGHHGASGRYARMKETAFIYAYALDKADLIRS